MVTEEVYDLLSKMKMEGESFTSVIRRLAKIMQIASCSGLWSYLDENEVKSIKLALKHGEERDSKLREESSVENP